MEIAVAFAAGIVRLLAVFDAFLERAGHRGMILVGAGFVALLSALHRRQRSAGPSPSLGPA